MSDWAQGTIEYLVILAVVVVISLVVVGLVVSQTGSVDSISVSSSQIQSKVGVGGISISNSVAGLDGNGLLVLQGAVGETLSVSKIVVNGVDHNYSTSLCGDESKSFKLHEVGSCSGPKKTYSIKVVYTSSSGLEKIADFKNMQVSCVDVVQTSGSVGAAIVEETIAPINYLITFNSQNATVEASPASKTVTAPATTVVTLPTAPTKTGYTFAGWFTEVEGDGTEFIASTVVTASISVYAKWTIAQTCGNGIIEGTEVCDTLQMYICPITPGFYRKCGVECVVIQDVGCKDDCTSEISSEECVGGGGPII